MEARRLAAAMTWVDARMFGAVSGAALLRGARAGAAARASGERGVRVEALVALTAHWNAVSRWAATALLFGAGEGARKRAKLLRFFVELAGELRALGNWSGLFAVVVGLGCPALAALRETWRLLPARDAALLRELEELCQPVANFRPYREALAKAGDAGTFALPYMAIVLKDLQAIEEGNPDKNAKGLKSICFRIIFKRKKK